MYGSTNLALMPLWQELKYMPSLFCVSSLQSSVYIIKFSTRMDKNRTILKSMWNFTCRNGLRSPERAYEEDQNKGRTGDWYVSISSILG